MSSYANFNSPQFVDFLNNETFDINDGADHFFGKFINVNFEIFLVDIYFKMFDVF